MIESKLMILKKLISEVDQEKSSNSSKVDPISLISKNMLRDTQPAKMALGLKSKQSAVETGREINKQKQRTVSFNKSKSMTDSPNSPAKIQNPQERYKAQFTGLARKLYETRKTDMDLKEDEINWQQFLKTFLLKNMKKGGFCPYAVDISGLGLSQSSINLVNQLLLSYRVVDLSRNIIKIHDIDNVKNSLKLQQLILKNCGMKNEQLCHLFQLLVYCPIKKLSISSPDIKDRNNLTRYQQLYNLIQKSQTLECLQMSNIQINPESQIFTYAKKSKNLKKIDLSKNTKVVGICKALTELNLSWNNISVPKALKCNDCSLLKLNLTGNPINQRMFQQFMTNINFPQIQVLILNKIVINIEAPWIQNFLQKTKSLKKLQLIDCELSKTTFLNIIFGLQQNRSLKSLNLSNNKMPIKDVAHHFSAAIKKSSLSRLYMQQCDIKDEPGSLLFQCLTDGCCLEYVDVSKNSLGNKTAQKLCDSLKKGCYSLLVLITTQNFIKYMELKEIIGYINRNLFLAKTKIKDQFKKYETLNENYQSKNVQIMQRISEAEQNLQILVGETQKMKQSYTEKQINNRKLQKQILEEKIKLLKQQQQILQNQKRKLENELDELGNQNINQNNQNQADQ